jgi:hypothetical protein
MATRRLHRWPSNRFTYMKQLYDFSAKDGIQHVRWAIWNWQRQRFIPKRVSFRLDIQLRNNHFRVKYPEFCGSTWGQIIKKYYH